mmetsp:Transcript_40119/g.110449  ORF Transcript_40119/g.110449 Transcript_40119/m.110449 type:complete len:165 (-) Transcript_40119:49-543(-)
MLLPSLRFSRAATGLACLSWLGACLILPTLIYPERIVGGHDVYAYPFLVQLRTPCDGTYCLCGGSLLSRLHVLTAAHCIETSYPAGETQVTTFKEHAGRCMQTISAAKVTCFDAYNPITHEGDVCVLELSEAPRCISYFEASCAAHVVPNVHPPHCPPPALVPS